MQYVGKKVTVDGDTRAVTVEADDVVRLVDGEHHVLDPNGGVHRAKALEDALTSAGYVPAPIAREGGNDAS